VFGKIRFRSDSYTKVILSYTKILRSPIQNTKMIRSGGGEMCTIMDKVLGGCTDSAGDDPNDNNNNKKCLITDNEYWTYLTSEEYLELLSLKKIRKTRRKIEYLSDKELLEREWIQSRLVALHNRILE